MSFNTKKRDVHTSAATQHAPRHASRPAPSSIESDPVDLITEHARVEGVLVAHRSMHFNGHLKGAIVHGFENGAVSKTDEGGETPTLWIGPNAQIEGVIVARRVVLNGHVSGKIYTQSLLHVSNLGNVVGEVTTRGLRLDYGGVINGASRMNVADMDAVIEKKLRETLKTTPSKA